MDRRRVSKKGAAQTSGASRRQSSVARMLPSARGRCWRRQCDGTAEPPCRQLDLARLRCDSCKSSSKNADNFRAGRHLVQQPGCFASSSVARRLIPVIFPPGRFRLLTRPVLPDRRPQKKQSGCCQMQPSPLARMARLRLQSVPTDSCRRCQRQALEAFHLGRHQPSDDSIL